MRKLSTFVKGKSNLFDINTELINMCLFNVRTWVASLQSVLVTGLPKVVGITFTKAHWKSQNSIYLVSFRFFRPIPAFALEN